MEVHTKKILLAGFRHKHHSCRGGYDQVVAYLKKDYFDANNLLLINEYKNLFCNSLNYFINKLPPIGVKPTTILDKLLLCARIGVTELIIKKRSYDYEIIHLIHPEAHVQVSISHNRIYIATVHLSLDWLNPNYNTLSIRKYLRRKVFQKVSGIIVLSSDQVELVKKYLPNVAVKFIPHGINALFINRTVSFDGAEKLKIVVIGSNYRDIDLLYEIVKYSESKEKKWEFDLIGVQEETVKIFQNFVNIRIHSYLEDKDYFFVLANSDIHFLPLNFATANNALLEAHIVGTPTVCIDLCATRDYSVSTTKFYSTFNEAIEKIESFEKLSSEEYLLIRKQTILESKKFSWEQIANETLNFYNEVFEKNKYKLFN